MTLAVFLGAIAVGSATGYFLRILEERPKKKPQGRDVPPSKRPWKDRGPRS